MTAAAQDRDSKNKLSARRIIDIPVAASTLLYAGTMIARNAAGNAVAATAASGLPVVGVSREKADNSSGSAGDIVVEVETGVHLMVNDGTATVIDPTHLGTLCYVQDDQTVGILATDSGAVAGIVEAVTTDGVYVYFAGDEASVAPDVTTEAIAAPGALSLLTKTSTLAVDGTDAFTLANGLYIGQKKYIVCIAAANTPAGTLTPASFTGWTTALFNAVGECLLIEWDGTGWAVLLVAGATLA
jgi:hypothetical protein